MLVDLYSLFLFDFADDTVVFGDAQLQAFGAALESALEQPGRRSGPWYRYDLTGSALLGDTRDLPPTVVELGYYHHRLIIHFHFLVRRERLRAVRDELQRIAQGIVNGHVLPALQQVVTTPGGSFEGVISYPLLIARKTRGEGATVPARRKPPFPFTEETTSLSFDLIEPVGLSARRHLLRISIAGTTLYADHRSSPITFPWRDVGSELKRDLLNAVYQYCLYPAKLKDRNRGQIDEDLLMRLWEHILNTTGGSTAQLIGAQFNQKSLLIAFVGLIISLIALNFWR